MKFLKLINIQMAIIFMFSGLAFAEQVSLKLLMPTDAGVIVSNAQINYKAQGAFCNDWRVDGDKPLGGGLEKNKLNVPINVTAASDGVVISSDSVGINSACDYVAEAIIITFDSLQEGVVGTKLILDISKDESSNLVKKLNIGTLFFVNSKKIITNARLDVESYNDANELINEFNVLSSLEAVIPVEVYEETIGN